MPKAYSNEEFLMSREARTLRILAEYMEPEVRLNAHNVNRGITFFGSARLRPGESNNSEGHDYYESAHELARQLAAWTTATHPKAKRYHLITGGGPGIMEAVNKGTAQANSALSVGFNISLPFEQVANPHVSPHLSFEFHYFFMRKFWLMNLAHAVVLFPGGFGTMDEAFETLTLIQTEKKPTVPVVFFGSAFWNDLIRFDSFVERGLISESDLGLFQVVDTVEDAFVAVRDGLL